MELPPRAGRVVAWGNALIAGTCSPDDADLGAVGTDSRHRVVGLADGGEAVSWAVAFALLRRSGTRRLRLALPVPGDPRGLAGPPGTTAAAVSAGEAVVTEGREPIVLVPTVASSRAGSPGAEPGAGPVVVRWDVLPAAPPAPDPADVAAADRDLRRAVLEAADALAALDLARQRPTAWAEVAAAEARAGREALPGLPSPAVALLRSAIRLAAIAELAGRDDGAAVTAGEATARRAALEPLARAARGALVAAYGAGAPPGAAAQRPER